MSFANHRAHFAELLEVRDRTKIDGMTVDELAAYASYLHGNLPTVIDAAMSLMGAHEVMAAKLANPVRTMRINLRTLVSATVRTLQANYHHLSSMLIDLQCFEINQQLRVLGYPVQLHIGQFSTHHDALRKIEEDMQNDALWDENTGMFQRPVTNIEPTAEQATS